MRIPLLVLMTAAQLCSLAFAAGLRPEPEMKVSEWAQKYRILPNTSAEPGEWHNERAPYLVEIMDNLSPCSPVEETSVMKSAQSGGTEAGNNWTAYTIHKAPAPMMYVQPTVETVKRYSRTRLAPLIESCPELRGRVKDAKSRDSGNTMLLKEFLGGFLLLTGANSAAGLRSMPIKNAFEDECDGYPDEVDQEGDPDALIIERTSTYRGRKIFRISTPTLVGTSRIHRAFLAGDQREYEVPCPLCEQMQPFIWRAGEDIPGGLVWPKEEPEKAQYQCAHCAKLIPEYRKVWMLAHGVWVPRAVCDPKIRSYHISALMAPYGWPGPAWPRQPRRARWATRSTSCPATAVCRGGG